MRQKSHHALLSRCLTTKCHSRDYYHCPPPIFRLGTGTVRVRTVTNLELELDLGKDRTTYVSLFIYWVIRCREGRTLFNKATGMNAVTACITRRLDGYKYLAAPGPWTRP